MDACDGVEPAESWFYEHGQKDLVNEITPADIDIQDFAMFTSRWQSNDPLTDIAPAERDNITNLNDFSVLCTNWLLGTEL